MISDTQLLIKQGTVGQLDDCRIGLDAVERGNPLSSGASAAITIVSPQLHANKCFLSLEVRKDDLVLVCGGFRRVLHVEPGEDGGSLLLNRHAVAVIAGGAGTSPRFDVMTVTPGAIARLVSPTGDPITPFASVELLAIVPGHDGHPLARFSIWPEGGDKAFAPTVQIVEIASGAHLEVQGRRHQVRVISLGDPPKGIPGFVELSTKPAS